MNSTYKRIFKNLFLVITAVFLFSQCKSTYSLPNFTAYKNTSISDSLVDDPIVDSLVSPYKKLLDKEMNRVIAHTDVDLAKSGLSSNIGNLLADIVFKAGQEYAQSHNLPPVDMALLNSGGIRISIPKGDITVGKVYELMPFENAMVLVTLNAKQMQQMFQYLLASNKGHPLSHIILSFNKNSISKLLIGNQPFDETRNYTIATNDYLYNGGDDMIFFKPYISVVDTGIKLRDIFIKEFEQLNQLPNIEENRLSIQ